MPLSKEMRAYLAERYDCDPRTEILFDGDAVSVVGMPPNANERQQFFAGYVVDIERDMGIHKKRLRSRIAQRGFWTMNYKSQATNSIQVRRIANNSVAPTPNKIVAGSGTIIAVNVVEILNSSSNISVPPSVNIVGLSGHPTRNPSPEMGPIGESISQVSKAKLFGPSKKSEPPVPPVVLLENPTRPRF